MKLIAIKTAIKKLSDLLFKKKEIKPAVTTVTIDTQNGNFFNVEGHNHLWYSQEQLGNLTINDYNVFKFMGSSVVNVRDLATGDTVAVKTTKYYETLADKFGSVIAAHNFLAYMNESDEEQPFEFLYKDGYDELVEVFMADGKQYSFLRTTKYSNEGNFVMLNTTFDKIKTEMVGK